MAIKSYICALKRILSNGSSQPLVAWTENIVVALIASYLWISSIDWIYKPNSLDLVSAYSGGQDFFWPVIFVILIALRYGFTQGFACAVLTVFMTVVYYRYHHIIDFYSFSKAVGLLLAAMITGEFRDVWYDNLKKNDLDYDFMKRKLELFTQNYFLLRSSHDQLEQRMAGQVLSLRSNISEIEKLSAQYPLVGMEQQKRLSLLATPVLSLFSSIVGIEEAGFYTITDNKKINDKAISTLGKMGELDLSDPMLKAMMLQKELLSPIDLYDEDLQGKYKLCIPLIDRNEKFLGCVIATEVKFFTLTDQNLAILNLVANYVSDVITTGVVAPVLLKQQIELFSKYFFDVLAENTKHKVQSSLLIFKGHTTESMQILDKTISMRRGADIYWKTFDKEGNTSLVVLLPMTTLYQAQLFKDRVLKQMVRADGSIIETQCIGPLDVTKDNQVLFDELKPLGMHYEKIANS